MNNSYVCIPADKLAAIIEESCPPLSGILGKTGVSAQAKIALNAGKTG